MVSLSQALPLGDCRLRSRDCSRLLASELDVKVSLHPAQASQRPCDGPVSSDTTCWLHDTTEKSMPSRGRQGHLVLQCNPDESQRLCWLGRQLAARRRN